MLYLLFGRFYAFGMAEYAFYNNTEKSEQNRYTNPESCVDSIKNEYVEFIDALYNCEPINIFLELSDVFHSIVKYISINYLPKYIYCNSFYWSLIFYTNIPVGIKLGNRYRINNCIRNHTNTNNCNHTCNYNHNYKKID